MKRSRFVLVALCIGASAERAGAQADLIFRDGFQATPNTCREAAAKKSSVGCEFWAADLDNAVDVVGVQGSIECLFTPGVTNATIAACSNAAVTAVAGLCDPPANACPLGFTCKATPVCIADAQHGAFSILVTNPQSQPATVTVQAASGISFSQAVAAGQSAVLLPQSNGIPDQSLDGTSVMSRAYKVTSDLPVAAYQAQGASMQLFSTGASLLVPRAAFGTEYHVLTWPTLDRRQPPPGSHSLHGYVSVVAPENGTVVEVTPTAGVRASATQPAIAAGAITTFTLAAHDVLTLQAVPGGDLTGTRVRCTDMACGVFGGHEAAAFGETTPPPGQTSGPCCAEHLEEMSWPASTWGTAFAVARSAPRGAGELDVLRVVGGAANTNVLFNPSPTGSCPTLGPGGLCEVKIAADTVVTSNQPILVGHYLQSATWFDPIGGTSVGSGDPEMALAVPVAQFRREYPLAVPSGYAENFLLIAAPAAGTVRVDGGAVALTPFPGGGYQGGRVPVSAGAHNVSCPDGCAVSVLGYGETVSFFFPAGLAASDPASADGTLAAWSSAAVDGGDLTIDGSSAMAGTSWGLSASVDDTNGLYVQDDSPDDEPRYRARFYVDASQFDPGTASGHFRTRILIAFSELPTRRVAAIVLRKLNGQYAVMGRARRDDNSQANTGFFPITAGPHAVELDLIASSGPDANDGAFTLWIDGVLVGSATGIDNSAGAVDFVRMGALSVKQDAAGLLYFDEFESRRETYIGLEP